MAQNTLELVIKAQDYASKELEKARLKTEKLWAQAEKTAAQIEKIKASTEKYRLQTEKASLQTEKLKNEITDLWKWTDPTNKSFSWLWKAIIWIWTAYLSVSSIINWAKWALTLSWQNEQARISFETLTWSISEAKRLLDDIWIIANNSPFDRMGLTTATQQLLWFWFNADQARASVLILWDAISAVWRTQDDLNWIILALWQIKAKGKLSMEEVLQIAERWIPIFDILKTKLWLTEKQIGDLWNQWIKSSVAITAILEWLNEKFAWSMDKQSKTLLWQWANFKDNLQVIWIEIWDNLSETAKWSLKLINDFITENASAIIDTISDLYKNFATVFSSIWNLVITTYDIISSAFGFMSDDWNETTMTIWEVFKWLFMNLSNWIIVVAWIFEQAFLWIEFIVKAIWTLVESDFNILINKAKALWNATLSLAKRDTETFKYIMSTAKKENDSMLKSAQDKIQDYITNTANKSEWAFKKSLESMTANLDNFNNSNSFDLWWEVAKNRLAQLEELKKKLKDLFDEMLKPTAPTKEQKDEIDKMMNYRKKARKEAEKIWASLWNSIWWQKDKLLWLKDEYWKLKDKLKEVWEKGAEELAKINLKLDEQLNKINWIKAGWKTEVANRALEIEKELTDLKKQQTEEATNERTEQIKKLEAELLLAKQYAWDEALATARIEAQKTETQKIIDKTNEKIKEWEAERLEIQKTYDLKKQEIANETLAIQTQMDLKKQEMISEFDLYKSLINQKQKLEKWYFEAYGTRIRKQMEETTKAINLLDQLAQKGGWLATSNNFIANPNTTTTANSTNKTSNININVWNVNASNPTEANSFIDKVKNALIQEAKNFNLWIL